jgi:hypothetical protein
VLGQAPLVEGIELAIRRDRQEHLGVLALFAEFFVTTIAKSNEHAARGTLREMFFTLVDTHGV